MENFALEHKIKSAAVVAVGALDEGSRMTVGPEDGEARPVTPLFHTLLAAHETAVVGTIFEGEDGLPRLHMHVSCGRAGDGLTGCIRVGSVVWQILEVIIFELTNCQAKKIKDESTGFEVLEP